MSDLQTRYRLLHGSDREAARAECARIKASGREVVVVSACLVGVRCRYDGKDKADPAAVQRHAGDAELVPLCPEVLAQLGVPRPTINLTADGTRALDASGRDVTAALDGGVRLADLFAGEAGATRALLKERSPSCGVHQVHVSSTAGGDGGLRDGEGRFTARLKRRGLPVVTERD